MPTGEGYDTWKVCIEATNKTMLVQGRGGELPQRTRIDPTTETKGYELAGACQTGICAMRDNGGIKVIPEANEKYAHVSEMMWYSAKRKVWHEPFKVVQGDGCSPIERAEE